MKISLYPFVKLLTGTLTRLSLTLLVAAALIGLPATAPAFTAYSTNFDSMNPGSIFGQEGWVNLNSNPNYPYNQAVTTAAAHSGSQSWLVSNSTNDGTVRAIGTPTFAQVGETNTVFGGTPAYHQFTESLWFRSVSTTTDPGLYVSNSLGTAASVRNTYFRISENAGSLSFDAIGGWDPNLGDFSQDPTVVGLTWGAWYQVVETATFFDGPNNDTVRYQLLDSLGVPLLDATIGSWEGYYMDPNVTPEQFPGPVASNQVSWGLFNSPGVQGLYIDDLSISLSVIPEPSTWAGGILIMTVGLVVMLRRRQARA